MSATVREMKDEVIIMNKGRDNFNKLKTYRVKDDETVLYKERRKHRYIREHLNISEKSEYISEKNSVYDSAGLDDFFNMHASADRKKSEKARRLTLRNNVPLNVQAAGFMLLLVTLISGNLILWFRHADTDGSYGAGRAAVEASAVLTPVATVAFNGPVFNAASEDVFYRTVYSLNQIERVTGSHGTKIQDEETIRRLIRRWGMLFIDQHAIGMPSGCEITSLAIVLSRDYKDICAHDISERFLDKREFTQVGGLRMGYDPTYYYNGDPTLPQGGFGIFAPGLVNAANRALPEFNIPKTAHDISGSSDEELFAYVSRYPVIVWIPLDLEPVNWDERATWYLPPYNTPYHHPLNLHCAVLVAYTDTTVTLYDPTFGVIVYDRDLFLQRWNEIGPFINRTRQAVVIK